MKGKFNGSIKNTLTHSVCALAVLAATSMPAMAESVDLAVTGTIIPAACVPSITGEIDYGNVTAAQMHETDYTVLPQKEVDFAINCGGQVKVAITATNGRPGTLAGGVEQAPTNTGPSPVILIGANSRLAAGLGAVDGKNIGGYAVVILSNSFMAGTSPVFLKSRKDGSTDVWSINSGTYTNLYQDPHFSWGDTAASRIPVAITNLTGKLVVQAYLNNTTELDPKEAIQLNGLTTIELVYL